MSCQIPKPMKNLLLLIGLLFATIGFSQPITVSTTNYTVPQLVNNVLINSPCVSATNITWRTGTNFGSSNGIGFFQNTNSSLPMDSGVILSTGNILNAPGPNTSILNDGSTAWTGDASLDATMAAAGIPMTSTNASVLEFDFTPISPNFSFDFVFASEEYGNFQCQYSDAFAFLLTNMTTGVTTNLAVVPNTTSPISVVTIRDFLYNSSCPSVNAQYFGSFNGGSGAAGSAINFNGQTVLLTAGSVLTPNTPYHIKLVIGDRTDPQSDSSIFISSDSFNIGQDVLGQNLTVANNTALCYGTNLTLNTGLSTTQYSFVWTEGEAVIPGATGSSLNINHAGTYGVTYTNLFSNCQPITDTVTIEYYPEINAPNPNTIYKCNTGAATYVFNLDLNTPVVKVGLDPLTVVTYFATQSDANNNANSLPLAYTSASGQTVYVRIQLPNSPCFIVKSFQLMTSAPPVANQPIDLVQCARSIALNNAFFNLSSQNVSILNGQSSTLNIISFYNSQNDANNAINPIVDTTLGIFTNQVVYVRVQNISDTNCYSTTTFNLIVNPAPIVDHLENVLVCTDYVLPPLVNGNYFTGLNGTGTPMFAGDLITQTQTLYIYNQPGGPNTCASNSIFKVTILDPLTIEPTDVTSCGSYTLPESVYGAYYTGPTATGVLIPDGTVITSTQVVYYYFTTLTAPFCVVDSDFNVTILNTVDVGTRPDVFDCTSYTLPALTVGNYYTAPGGNGTQIPVGTVITSDQTVYVYASTGTNSLCTDEDSFDVFIGFVTPADIAQCNGYTLPQLPIGNYFTGPMGTGQQIDPGTVINATATVYIYIPINGNSTSNCSDNLHFNINISQPIIDTITDQVVCESFTLPSLTNGEYFTGIDGTGTQLFAGDVIITTQTIYIRKVLSATCANQSSFTVTVIGIPQIDSRSDIDICDQYVLTALTIGNYYTGPNGTGTMLTAGTVITSSQLIYIYATSTGTLTCTAQNSFQINIFSTSADAPANVTACDSYTLPALSASNKYYTQTGGENGAGVEILAGTVLTSTQTVYVYKESIIRTSFSCYDENSFIVTINHTPVITPIANVNACNSYTLPALTTGNYFTSTNGSGTTLNAGDVITTNQTLYVFAQTNTTPNCSSEISFTVTIFNVDTLPNVTNCEGFNLPSLSVGNYYSGPNGTGTVLTVGSLITTTRTIYIYAQSPFLPICSDESSFTVTIVNEPVAHLVPAIQRTVCDDDGTNDGITTFDFTTISNTVLGSQTGTEFTVSYYGSLEDATAQTNAFTSSNLAVAYVRVNNNLAPNCYDIKALTIIVNKIPEPTPLDGIICIDSETGQLLNPYTMYSGLSAATHTFVWTNEAGNTVGTGSSYQAVLPGVYTVVATKTSTGCSSGPITVTVSPSEPAIVTYTVSDDFSDNQIITVVATGNGGIYEYQLDNGPFQDSPIFDQVVSGIHTITVRDKNGCGTTTVDALVVNYPHFFTPNGDGYNDTWNIIDLSNQPNAKIDIYDRYGKILKQIKPNGEGWDGRYNGHEMLSDDYWFSVTYVDENQVGREFKSHFAMKR